MLKNKNKKVIGQDSPWTKYKGAEEQSTKWQLAILNSDFTLGGLAEDNFRTFRTRIYPCGLLGPSFCIFCWSLQVFPFKIKCHTE